MHDLVQFELEYERKRTELQSEAQFLEEYLVEVLKEERVEFHAVSVRAKATRSAVRKLRDKKYSDPWQDMMDMIGGRVFTYFRSDWQIVEEALRKHFDIDEANSIHKADDLEYNTFGYTSRHLICKISSDTQSLHLKRAACKTFEIQIRTVLEHGWAEVEHELVYKAMTSPPKDIRRRFAASAAALEIVEREFDALRTFEFAIVKERIPRVPDCPSEKLDRAWMFAVLETQFPKRATWSPESRLNVFYGGDELVILDVLRRAGIVSVGDWKQLLSDSKTSIVLTRYAFRAGLEVSGLSHRAISSLAAALALGKQESPELQALLDSNSRDALTDATDLPPSDTNPADDD